MVSAGLYAGAMAWRAVTELQAHTGLRGGSGVVVTVSVRRKRAERRSHHFRSHHFWSGDSPKLLWQSGF
jgi:hypothetical protein